MRNQANNALWQDLRAEIQNSLDFYFTGLQDMQLLAEAALEDLPQAPKVDFAEKQQQLQALHTKLKNCNACDLHIGREKPVFGKGNPNAELCFIGMAPNGLENNTGVPFQGATGAMLKKMVQAMGHQMEDVYLLHIVKCMPPNMRAMKTKELDQCEQHLIKQLEIISPKYIISFGEIVAQQLIRTEAEISALRGKWYRYKEYELMPTWSLEELQQKPKLKKESWTDLQLVMAKMQQGPNL